MNIITVSLKFVSLVGPLLEIDVDNGNGNGITFIYRTSYVDIFKCALQHFVGDFCQTAL